MSDLIKLIVVIGIMLLVIVVGIYLWINGKSSLTQSGGVGVAIGMSLLLIGILGEHFSSKKESTSTN